MSLLVFEGLDGSGKGTQAKLFCQMQRDAGRTVKEIDFPNYGSPAAGPVQLYLSGAFGKDADAVNAYAASSFFAVDRYASYMTDWKRDYENGSLIFANRYVTSNMVYQLGKLPKEQWNAYIAWLEDFEYNKLGLPRPDAVVYLDMPIEISQKLLSGRYAGNEQRKDIHENNLELLRRSRECGLYLCSTLHWLQVNCAQNGSPRSREDISGEISRVLQPYLQGDAAFKK